MSLTRFSVHPLHHLFFSALIQPARRFLFLFCANGFPVEGSTWISQTIYPKLQENWPQILEGRQTKEEKKNDEVKMIHRAFIH